MCRVRVHEVQSGEFRFFQKQLAVRQLVNHVRLHPMVPREQTNISFRDLGSQKYKRDQKGEGRPQKCGTPWTRNFRSPAEDKIKRKGIYKDYKQDSGFESEACESEGVEL
jgi:hypothetical protein